MSSIKLQPNASGTGTFTIAAPDGNTNRTLTLPDATGTVVLNEGSGTFKIDSSGNVGIGTTAPSYKFVVSDADNEGLEIDPVSTASQVRLLSYNRTAAGYTGLNSLASEHIWSIGSVAKMQLNESGALGVGGANYGTAGQVLQSNGFYAAPSWAAIPVPTSAQVGTATAGLAVGAVGTYAMLRFATATTATAGSTHAGSGLRYSSATAVTGGTPGGTWRLMGETSNASTTASTSVFLRIS